MHVVLLYTWEFGVKLNVVPSCYFSTFRHLSAWKSTDCLEELLLVTPGIEKVNAFVP